MLKIYLLFGLGFCGKKIKFIFDVFKIRSKGVCEWIVYEVV